MAGSKLATSSKLSAIYDVGEVLVYRVRLAFHLRDATKVQSEMALTPPIEHDE